jgi:membrane associated rhomboid family serine protease
MRTRRMVPFVTLTLVLLITIIQIFRSIGGSYDEFVLTNLNVISWELLYNQPWRILTSPFLHQNLLHFLENLLFLLLFGRNIEQTHGPAYLLGAFFGALVTGHVIYINGMHDWLIGISGGVCGLFGFSLIANHRTPWWTTLTRRPLHVLYIANLLWAVILDSTHWLPYRVAHLDHLVGILYGMAFGGAFLLAPRGARWRWAVIALPLVLFTSLFYSPWQVEWRLVKRPPILVTTEADCQLRSPEQNVYVAAHIRFVNTSTKSVAAYWLDYRGKARYELWLRPGDSGEQNSFVGHPFCIVAVDSGEALQAVTVTEPGQIIIIH